MDLHWLTRYDKRLTQCMLKTATQFKWSTIGERSLVTYNWISGEAPSDPTEGTTYQSQHIDSQGKFIISLSRTHFTGPHTVNYAYINANMHKIRTHIIQSHTCVLIISYLLCVYTYHFFTLGYITFPYNKFHSIPLHYTTWHSIPLHGYLTW